jgi:nitroreductase
MDIYEALYTTRAMRRMTADAVPHDVIGRILDAGLRAPTGGNAQDWRFVAVTDPDKIQALGVHYKAALGRLFEGHYKAANEEVRAAVAAGATDRRVQQVARVLNSSEHLAEHFGEAPLLVFGFSQTAGNPGSVWPALWSMCLAARAEGVGSTVTTVLGTFAADETAQILGIPAGEKWIQHACLPMGYPTGRWGIPDRKPISKVCFHDSWGSPAGFPIPTSPV